MPDTAPSALKTPVLDPAGCKLLRDDRLVERFNAVSRILERAAGQLPRFRERQIVPELVRDLDRLAGTMRKERFQIGFIGPSQAGKSSTINNLLRVIKDEDAPTPRGNGAPTTSVPTRIVPVPPGPDARCAVHLRYYSRSEFRERVCDICDLLKLPYDENHARLRETVVAQQQEKPHFKAADHVVLIKLLDAALKFPDVIGDVGRRGEGDFAQRRGYLTHQDEVTEYTLLRDVQISYVTDAIHPEVEMVDLPGLGVDKESDDLLTLSLVHTLDGAFMFQESTQLAAVEVAKLAERMRERYTRTLGERLWMVVTRCDTIDELGLTGPLDEPNPRSVFCHLESVMKRQGINLANAIFVGNAYYKRRVAEELADDHLPTDALRTAYATLLRFGPDGAAVIPDKCAAYPGQVDPWRRFMLNGGIPSLRETMQTKVADTVREQTRREVGLELNAIIERFSAALMAAEQQSGMTVEEMMRAARWSGELDRLVDEVGADAGYSQEAATAITGKLGGLINDWGAPDRGGLAKGHDELAGVLAMAGLHESDIQTGVVLGKVEARLRERLREQPPPDAPGLQKPLEFWGEAVANRLKDGKTRDGRGFRAEIFQGFRSDPSPIGEGGHGTTATEYPAVMRAKAARLARVYSSRLVHEIQAQLRSLQARYRAVGTEIDHIDKDQREQYATYRAELDRLRI